MLLSLLLATAMPFSGQEEVPSPMLERWEVVGSSERGEHAIDPATLTRSGDTVHAFVRVRLPAGDGDEAILGVMEYRYDCKAKTARRLGANLYEPDGKLRAAIPVPPAQQRDEALRTESPNGQVAARVCR